MPHVRPTAAAMIAALAQTEMNERTLCVKPAFIAS